MHCFYFPNKPPTICLFLCPPKQQNIKSGPYNHVDDQHHSAIIIINTVWFILFKPSILYPRAKIIFNVFHIFCCPKCFSFIFEFFAQFLIGNRKCIAEAVFFYLIFDFNFVKLIQVFCPRKKLAVAAPPAEWTQGEFLCLINCCQI